MIVQHMLAERTLAYWELSCSWNGVKGSKAITVETAISDANDALENLGPQRRLYRRLIYLQHYIVMGDAINEG